MSAQRELFETTKQYMLENSIPENRQQAIAAVLEMTGVDVTPRLNSEDAPGDSLVDPTALTQLYTTYRAAHRIARPGSHIAIDRRTSYLGRHSSTRSSRMWGSVYDTISRIAGWGQPHASSFMRRPIVISEEAELNMNAEVLGDEEHLLIQLLNLEGFANTQRSGGDNNWLLRAHQHNNARFATTARTVSGIHFHKELYRSAVQPVVDQLTEAGWTIVELTFNIEDRTSGAIIIEALPVGAIPPDNHPQAGKFVVMLMNLHGNYQTPPQIVMELAGYAHEQNERVNPRPAAEDSDAAALDRAMISYSFMMQARAAIAGVERVVEDLSASIRSREQRADEYRQTLGSEIRIITDEQRQLNEMRRATGRVALQSVEEILTLPEMLESMRQVNTVRMESNEGRGIIVEFTTHPFGMSGRDRDRYDDNDQLVRGREIAQALIVPIKVRIDLTQNSFSAATRLTAVDGGAVFHPHISRTGDHCWGAGATALAESYGRRDWESFVRLLLAWITQYNHDSPYTYIDQLSQHRGRPERTGWLIPEEPEAAEVPAAEEQVELVTA